MSQCPARPAASRLAVRLTCTACVLCVLGAGCASSGPPTRIEFSREVDKVRPGMSQSEVRSRLGDPDRRREGTISLHPDPLPAANLAAYAPLGTPYREWDYKRADSRYHVFFVPDASRGGWQVLTVKANPAGAE